MAKTRKSQVLKCGEHPCETCPYRKDTPKAVWALEEYEKLPAYDGGIIDQVVNGAVGIFQCHYDNGNLCRGWLDCHSTHGLAAIRLRGRRIEGYDEKSPRKFEVYESGQAVLDANKPLMNRPSKASRAVIEKVSRIPGKKFG